MTSEQRRDFQLRISQANKAALIVILYEICLQYIEDSYKAETEEDKNASLDKVRECIDEMMQNLNFEYEISKTLKQLYIYCRSCIREVRISGNIEKLEKVRRIMERLHNAYDSIKEEDTTGSVMIHTQAVLTGLTYGKNKILEELTNDCSNRGYRV